MAHVGIQRLRPRHRQHDAAEREESEPAVEHEEIDRVVGVERPQDLGRLPDLPGSERGDDDEVDDHHRREQRADLRRPALLQHEQCDQQRKRDRDHEPFKPSVDHRQALDRRQHGDRRRDHAVAVEQRGREHAQQHRDPAITRFRQAAADQRDKGERAALPLVIRPHQDRDVLDRDDQRHRPEDQAYHAQHVRSVQLYGRATDKGFAESVERARPDIAEHDADRADRERGLGRAVALASGWRVVRRRGVGGCGVAHDIADALRTVGGRRLPIRPRGRHVAPPARSRNMSRAKGASAAIAAIAASGRWRSYRRADRPGPRSPPATERRVANAPADRPRYRGQRGSARSAAATSP